MPFNAHGKREACHALAVLSPDVCPSWKQGGVPRLACDEPMRVLQSITREYRVFIGWSNGLYKILD